MLSAQIQVFARANGFIEKQNLAFGIFDGFFISVNSLLSRKNAFINFFDNETSESTLFTSKLSESINELNEKYKLQSYDITENSISVSTNAELLAFDELLHSLCNLLRSKGFSGASACSSCGVDISEGARKVIVIDGNAYLVCESCAADFTANDKKEIEKPNALKNTEDSAERLDDEESSLLSKDAGESETSGEAEVAPSYSVESESADEAESTSKALSREDNSIDESDVLYEEAEEIKENPEYKEEKKPFSRKKGIIGAVIGAFIGMAAFIAAYIYVLPEGNIVEGLNGEFLSLPFAAIIALLSFIFYSVFSKSKGMDRTTPALVASLCALFIAQYIGSLSVFVKENIISRNHFDRTLQYFYKFPFTDKTVRSDFLLFFFINVVVVIIVGFIFSYASESREKKVQVEIYDF